MQDVLKYKDFIGTVHFSADDEVFFGKIFGINDLVTFEGKSVKELKNAFHEAVDDYVETCLELKKQPEKSFKGSFNVRVSNNLHRTVAAIATAHSISLNDFVKNALAYAVDHPGIIQTKKV